MNNYPSLLDFLICPQWIDYVRESGTPTEELCLGMVQNPLESPAGMELASTCQAFKSENIWGQSRLKSRLKYCPFYTRTFPHHFDPIPPRWQMWEKFSHLETSLLPFQPPRNVLAMSGTPTKELSLGMEKYCPLCKKTFPHYFDPTPPRWQMWEKFSHLETSFPLPPSFSSLLPSCWHFQHFHKKWCLFRFLKFLSPLFPVVGLWSDDKMQIRKVARLKKCADIDS